jgi:hypothetical protein
MGRKVKLWWRLGLVAPDGARSLLFLTAQTLRGVNSDVHDLMGKKES